MSDGTLTAQFVVADVPAGSYGVVATGSPDDDSANAVFHVGPGTPTITLDPQTSAPGGTVQISGTSFSTDDSNCTVSDNGAGQNETCSIDLGIVSASFIVANATAGRYTITVTGSPDGDWASQTFNITSPPLSIVLNETSSPVGAAIQVSGSGFPATDSNCTLSGDVVTAANCSLSGGDLAGSFLVANVTAGTYVINATGSPSGDNASTNFTVTAPFMNETVGNSTAPDFSITSSPFVTLRRGGSGVAAVSVSSLNGFNSSVTLSAAWIGASPTGVNVTLPPPITPVSGGSANESLTITASSYATTGTYQLQVTGMSGSLTHTMPSNVAVQILQAENATVTPVSTSLLSTHSTTSYPNGPTCAVSSATSGTELAPLVQTLRAFRDQSILRTRTGKTFMTFFNAWYFSFSPRVASYVSTHRTQRMMFRYALYPLIGILYASYYTYLVVSPLNNEVAAVTSGLVAAGMLGFIYIGIPLYSAGRAIRGKVRVSMPSSYHVFGCSAICGLLVGMTYVSGGEFALGVATLSLVLSTLALGASLGIHVLRYIDFAYRFTAIVAISKPLKSFACGGSIRLRLRGEKV